MTGDLQLFDYGPYNDGTSGGDTAVAFPLDTDLTLGTNYHADDLFLVVVLGLDEAVSFSMDGDWVKEYDYPGPSAGRITVFSHTAVASESDYTVTGSAVSEFMFEYLVYTVDPTPEPLQVGTGFATAEVSSASAIDLGDIAPGWALPLETRFCVVLLDLTGTTFGNPSPFSGFETESTANLGVYFTNAEDIVTHLNPGSASLTPDGDAIALGFGVARQSEVAAVGAATNACYDVEALDYLSGGDDANAFAINAAGVVAGYSNATDGFTHAVRWNGASATALDYLDGGDEGAIGYGIDADEVVVGYSQVTFGAATAVTWTGTTPTALDFLSGGADANAYAINVDGIVSGYSDDGSNSIATYWTGTSATELDRTNASYNSFGYALNASELIVGSEFQSAASWTGTAITLLDFLSGGTQASAYGVNDSDLIVGYSNDGTLQHAVTWTGTTPTALDFLPGGDDGTAQGVNTSGVVCGAGRDAAGLYHGVVWIGGNPKALPFLPGGDDAWGYAINDSGQIAGYSNDGDGYYHAVVWTPCGTDGYWGVLLS